MNASLVSAATLFVAAIVLALIQLWFLPINAVTFIKCEMTLGAFFVISVAIWYIRKEYGDFKRQQTDARLDE